jgi:hypothetical protein
MNILLGNKFKISKRPNETLYIWTIQVRHTNFELSHR